MPEADSLLRELIAEKPQEQRIHLPTNVKE